MWTNIFSTMDIWMVANDPISSRISTQLTNIPVMERTRINETQKLTNGKYISNIFIDETKVYSIENIDVDKHDLVDIDVNKHDLVDVDGDKHDLVDIDGDKHDLVEIDGDKHDLVDIDGDKHDMIDLMVTNIKYFYKLLL